MPAKIFEDTPFIDPEVVNIAVRMIVDISRPNPSRWAALAALEKAVQWHTDSSPEQFAKWWGVEYVESGREGNFLRLPEPDAPMSLNAFWWVKCMVVKAAQLLIEERKHG